MNFCYLHPTREAQGQCSACRNWICMNDYSLVKENIGEVQGWVKEKPRRFWPRRKKPGYKLITKMQTGPVIYCKPCHDKKMGIKHSKKDDLGILNENKKLSSKRILMCNQCGEKIREGDKYCPKCGDTTQDEFFDATHPLKGIQSAKTLR